MEPYLTKPTKYDIEDSNIALLGSDLEKRVREHAGDKELAWDEAGLEPGLQTWRIEKFHVVPWPKAQEGRFYDGDSYIVLYTYKKTPEAESFSYDLHFWLGEETSQDEAGTAAYKTVELDDHLHGIPVQYREVQGYESDRFLSHFPRGFVCLKGGISTGFHHVTDMPPADTHKLYRISITPNPHPSHPHGAHTNYLSVIREVPFAGSSLVEGDVFVMDRGTKVWQLNTKESAGKEKFRAAEFVRSLSEGRKGGCEVTVLDEGGHGTGIFLAEFGENTTIHRESESEKQAEEGASLYRLSDASGTPSFTAVEPPISFSSLSSSDAFILDNTFTASSSAAIYVWLGSQSSLTERRLAVQYAQSFLHDKKLKLKTDVKSKKGVAIPIVRMQEGQESEAFKSLLL
ncbi:fragmin60 [Lentinula raphanica]|uniref:Fragmin60 n=1 Tax=Lentinula raphanica TaxID=153919 RepID=A0AA38P407_9AGAR|nr:fragmin60 [Lentinula raphanica]KAJ3835913.1 fragmin60 [Lentinula raphanica]KAJ3968509.1 fragmin60 [Lentinula raphanica]